MKHVMIDLETMGNGTDAAIVSIGAVEFDHTLPSVGDSGGLQLGKMGREFYRVVELQSSLDSGLRVDASTIYWWLQKSEEARKALLTPDNGWKTDLWVALEELTEFWREACAEIAWAHGDAFDIAILNTAYRKLKKRTPWKYNAVRDTRTFFDTLDAWPSKERMAELNPLAHHALGDAKAEVQCMLDAVRARIVIPRPVELANA